MGSVIGILQQTLRFYCFGSFYLTQVSCGEKFLYFKLYSRGYGFGGARKKLRGFKKQSPFIEGNGNELFFTMGTLELQ